MKQNKINTTPKSKKLSQNFEEDVSKQNYNPQPKRIFRSIHKKGNMKKTQGIKQFKQLGTGIYSDNTLQLSLESSLTELNKRESDDSFRNEIWVSLTTINEENTKTYHSEAHQEDKKINILNEEKIGTFEENAGNGSINNVSNFDYSNK